MPKFNLEICIDNHYNLGKFQTYSEFVKKLKLEYVKSFCTIILQSESELVQNNSNKSCFNIIGETENGPYSLDVFVYAE